MNILVVSRYGLYQSCESSFVHAQAQAYAALGHRVRVLILIPLGKKNWEGKRLFAPLQRVERDGLELYLLRFLSLSNYGERGFNAASAARAIRNRLDAILDAFAPDVIHAHTLGFGSGIGACLKGKLGVPLVVTSHGSDASVPLEQGRGAELEPYCDKADAVVAVSSALAGKIRSCGTKVPISAILNGFLVQNLSPGEAERGFSLIQVGNLLRQKRFHITLQAFARLREVCPEAALTLIGQGPERDSLDAMCRELGISESVRFLGQVPNSQVLEEMSKSRFFVMPSVREGFGIVYLEAMASGCITIGTEGEGIADLIESGKNGFLVPADNPESITQTIEWCLEHTDEAAAIAEQGRQDALGLTWEKNAQQYIRLFKELID